MSEKHTHHIVGMRPIWKVLGTPLPMFDHGVACERVVPLAGNQPPLQRLHIRMCQRMFIKNGNSVRKGSKRRGRTPRRMYPGPSSEQRLFNSCTCRPLPSKVEVQSSIVSRFTWQCPARQVSLLHQSNASVWLISLMHAFTHARLLAGYTSSLHSLGAAMRPHQFTKMLPSLHLPH